MCVCVRVQITATLRFFKGLGKTFEDRKNEYRKVPLGNYKMPKQRIQTIDYRVLKWTIISRGLYRPFKSRELQ